MASRIISRCVQDALRRNTRAKRPKYHHFSYAVQESKILASGTNLFPGIVELRPRASVHAEVVCFRKARGLLDTRKPWEMVNIRLTRHNEIALAKPCPCCYGFLKAVGVSRVWFTTYEGFASLEF